MCMLMRFLVALLVGATFPLFAFLLAIYFFACIVIGLLLPLIPILIMQLCGMPKTEWVLIGNYLFTAGVLGGIAFFLYTTYLFLREVRKKPNNETTSYLDRFLR